TYPERHGLTRALWFAGLAHCQLNVAALTDDGVLRRDQNLDAPVELVGAAGEQRMNRSIEAERRGIFRHIVDLPVCHHDNARKPVRRRIGKRFVQALEQVGAGRALSIGAGRRHPTDLQAWDLAELRLKISSDGLSL